MPHAGQSHFLHFSRTLSVAVRAAVRAAHAAWSSGGSARGSVPGLSALSPAADLRGALRGSAGLCGAVCRQPLALAGLRSGSEVRVELSGRVSGSKQ